MGKWSWPSHIPLIQWYICISNRYICTSTACFYIIKVIVIFSTSWTCPFHRGNELRDEVIKLIRRIQDQQVSPRGEGPRGCWESDDAHSSPYHSLDPSQKYPQNLELPMAASTRQTAICHLQPWTPARLLPLTDEEQSIRLRQTREGSPKKAKRRHCPGGAVERGYRAEGQKGTPRSKKSFSKSGLVREGLPSRPEAINLRHLPQVT